MEWMEFVIKLGMWDRYNSCCNCYNCEFVREQWRLYQELGDEEYWKANDINQKIYKY